MNIHDYRTAMERIVPGGELKGRIMNQAAPQRRNVPLRRVLAGALAAVVVLTCLASAALAASPELRTAVLSFFRIEEREQVPVPDDASGQSGSSQDGDFRQPDISQAEIGELVKAQYIRMDRHYGFSGALLNDLVWSDDSRTLLEADFWEVKNNELVPVQVDMRTNRIDITFQDIRYQGNLYWFVRNDALYFFQGAATGAGMLPGDQWNAETIPGRTDVLLLKLARGRQMDYTEYPVLYHLDTGETEDILAGTGVDRLEYAYDYLWSEDMRKVLVSCSPDPDTQQEWFCDLDAKTLTRLEDLSGLDGAVSAGFADNNTLVLTTHTTAEDGTWLTVTCYAFDPASGQRTKTMDGVHCYHWWEEKPYGVRLFGSRCVLIGQDGQVRLVDLKTGAQTLIDGFTYQKGDEFLPGPSGEKLLYYAHEPAADDLGISRLGVADLEKGTFIAFDREGYDGLYEQAIGWSGDNTVSINATASDGGAQYLILYTF